MSHHAMSLRHLSQISERIRVSRLVVDDDDVRQGQADRLFQARDAGTEEVGAMPRGDQDRHSGARLVLEPLPLRTTASLLGPAPR